MKYTIAVLLTALVVAACGSNDTPSKPFNPPGHGGGNGPNGGGGSIEAINTYLPLSKDRVWTYKTKAEPGSMCAEESELKITGEADHVDGKHYFVLMGTAKNGGVDPCLPAGAFHAEGDKILLLAGEWVTYLDDNTQEGHTWKTLYGDYKYGKKLDSVKTEAGTFSDCIVRTNDAAQEELTFCRGVGLVRLKSIDSEGELIKKNF